MDYTTYNKIPDIDSYSDRNFNPTLVSPNSPFQLPFYQTRETLIDIETYKRFLENAISRFRRSITYKHYKGHLLDLGLDHCQFHGNINSEMATIEMNHVILTIFDVSLIITEHILNTVGYITTFDLVQLLKEAHKEYIIPLNMFALTPHQLYHSNPDFYVHPSMVFGNWPEFLQKYRFGITRDIAFKILLYIKKSMELEGSTDNNLLELRDNIINWSEFNDSKFN